MSTFGRTPVHSHSMSIGTAKPTAGAMSTATTFSYAQAAKGQSVTQAAPSQPSPNQPTPASSKPSQDTPTVVKSGSSTSSATVLAAPNGNESVEPISSAPTITGQVNSEVELKRPNEESVATPKSSTAPSISSSQGIERSRVESASQGEEKQGRSSNMSSRAPDSNDARKKKGKKAKVADKDIEQDTEEDTKEYMAPIQPELTEAPIPVVNIWQQRIEAQAAKAKTAPLFTASSRSSANGATNAASLNGDQKPRSLPSDPTHSNTAHNKPSFANSKPPKKGTEQVRNGNDQAFRRAAPRGSRANEKEARPAPDALPSVANTASWPTPETAAVETKSQIHTDRSDKDEKEDKDESIPSKSRQKWVPIPFVPSVNFNTPLPTRGGPRGGGRAGSTRGARDGASRGHQNAGLAVVNGNREPHVIAMVLSADRDQGNESDPKSTSVAPQTSKRTFADTPGARESRKPTTSTDSLKHAGSSSSVRLPNVALRGSSHCTTAHANIYPCRTTQSPSRQSIIGQMQLRQMLRSNQPCLFPT